MTIALIGPAGSGKGTQAIKVVSKYDWLHISTGDLFRAAMSKNTALGLLGQRYMSRGELIPDEVVDAMIEEQLLKIRPEKDILFNGFPRTRYQAEFLDELLEKMDRKLDAAIYLKVSDDNVLKRLPGRYVCQACHAPYHTKFKPPAREEVCDRCHSPLYRREDDRADIIRTRLKVSHRVTGGLAGYYQRTGKLIIVDGNGTIDEVADTVLNTIDTVLKREAISATAEETTQIQSIIGEVAALTPEEAHPSLNLVLLGGPGSGKGTQADQLKTNMDIPHISTGDIFRENLKNKTDLGKLAKTYMDRGDLVPDDVTESMVEDRLDRPDTEKGFIMDGFPRTIGQAEALTEMMVALNRRIDAVLHIKVGDEEIVNRLSGRLICRNCQTPYHRKFNPPTQEGVCDACGGELYQRDDDNPDTIRTRLKTYHRQTAPLIEYYRKAGTLIEIDGEQDVAVVSESTLAAVQKLADEGDRS